jgi:hypothetical protein
MSIQAVRVSISEKGKGETDFFQRSYGLRDYSNDVPVNDGHAYANQIMDLTPGYIVSVDPIPDAELEAAVSSYLNIETDKLINKVIDPLQSCYRTYSLTRLCGKLIAISTRLRFGYKYGVVDPEWVKEAGKFSSINMPESA